MLQMAEMEHRKPVGIIYSDKFFWQNASQNQSKSHMFRLVRFQGTNTTVCNGSSTPRCPTFVQPVRTCDHVLFTGGCECRHFVKVHRSLACRWQLSTLWTLWDGCITCDVQVNNHNVHLGLQVLTLWHQGMMTLGLNGCYIGGRRRKWHHESWCKTTEGRTLS